MVFLIRTPIYSRKKRNGFFIVVSTLVATCWLLMLGKFETKARILGMKPQVCCRPFLLYQKIHISYALPYGHEKREMIFYSSKYISSHQVATNVRKI